MVHGVLESMETVTNSTIEMTPPNKITFERYSFEEKIMHEKIQIAIITKSLWFVFFCVRNTETSLKISDLAWPCLRTVNQVLAKEIRWFEQLRGNIEADCSVLRDTC